MMREATNWCHYPPEVWAVVAEISARRSQRRRERESRTKDARPWIAGVLVLGTIGAFIGVVVLAAVFSIG